MAKTYKWPDGSSGHTISYQEHQANMAAQAKARAQEEAQNQQNKAKAQTPTGPPKGLPAPTPGNPGGTPPPATVEVAGTPGVRRDPTKPFATGAQMGENSARQSAWAQAVIDIDKAIADIGTQTEYEKAQIEKAKTNDKENAQNQGASAGFLGSSVVDGDLFDIDATARLRKEFLDNNMRTAKTTADNKKGAITDEKTSWEKAYNQMQVENASAVDAGLDPYVVQPTGPTTITNPDYTAWLAQFNPNGSPIKGGKQAPIQGTKGPSSGNPWTGTGNPNTLVADNSNGRKVAIKNA